MNKPVVVHVITNFAGVGGAEMMLSRLVAQTQAEYEHIIISLMHVSNVYAETLKLCSSHYSLNWKGINSFSVMLKLRTLLQQIQPNVVQGWMYHANVMTSLSLLGMQQKPPVFWGVHHSLASPKEESLSTKVALNLSKIFSQQPKGIVYCAHSSLEQHQAFGFNNANQQVIANGVALDQFQVNEQLHEPITIGFAGRYHTAKGYAYLLQVIAELKDQPIIFKIAGSGANLDTPEIKQAFAEHQLDPQKVQLFDQVSGMPAFYQSLDAFLMTSITEGFPNVLVEAMASGLPCITTDVGDAKYIVEDMGWVVAPRDVAALKAAILEYVKLSQADKHSLKQQTRARVEQNFSIQHVSQQYMTVWRQG
ncbi:glycosyltransferase [Acinetobacter johnsonii]|jgi:glycosyltransferase involved in cell wall biosynthesis|uniref:glycosyltransferase n=1 Tax=Acinetobacter TaxID=469 RepID=UPI001596E026|nr:MULTISPECIES: glycosyltransferase [Acinetobacter]MDH1487774.1 glycosyltransferase [Acinetobacter johnsonii]MDH1613705.1 glycosyltransferase [Acinetobacter johnsonii]MDV2486553.1 glycosyltransferase [Acinetobacter johnsonii]QKY89324.1 glycosyltransferase [Acinetobacter sp. NEB 394]